MSFVDKELYTFSDFRLDAGERQLFQNENRLLLTEKAFEVLCLLVREHGSLVTKDRFFDEIWQDTVVEPNNLDKCISLIRRTLGEQKSGPKFIETVRGHGYRFIAKVNNTILDPANGISPFPLNSIAVVPFNNLSQDIENEFFCDGLAEELLNSLSRISGLKVAARTSSFTFKGKGTHINDIAEILQVRTILEGSVRRSNDHVRITVRLIDAVNGYSIWSENYDREIKDIFDIQDEIALSVIDSLKVSWLGGERDAVLKRHTADPAAYLLYMKGQYYRWKGSEQAFANSLKYFERSVEIDPLFALGHFGISTFYGYGTAWGLIPIEPKKGWTLAESAIQKAIAIDESLVETKLSLAAFSLVKYRKWDEARTAIKSIAESNPYLPEIHHLYSFYLLGTGEFDAAVTEARHALDLDPLSVLFSRFLSQCLYFCRRYEDAISQLKGALELDANNYLTHYLLSEIYLKKGLADESLASWQNAERLDSGNQHSVVSNSLSNGDIQTIMKATARKRLNGLFERSKSVEYVPSIFFARQYVVLNDTENAFEWLDKACDELNVFPFMIHGDPFLSLIHI